MILVLYIFAFVMGAMVGSFLNVCIYRLPRGLSVLWPPSHCTWCNEKVAWFDNIPVVSYLVLGGRCRLCGTAFSIRYAFVEAMTGAVFVYLSYHFVLRPGVLLGDEPFHPVQMLVAGVLCSALIVVSMIDLERQIIPDEITFSGMVTGPLLSALFPALHNYHSDPLLRPILSVLDIAGTPALAALLSSLVGLVVAGGFIYFTGAVGTRVFRKEAMGFGDVKLMAVLGAFMGWRAALVGILIGCVYGAALGVIIWIIRRDSRIPFGPYLSLGCVTVLLFTPDLMRLWVWWNTTLAGAIGVA